MLRFKNYLREEVIPTAGVKDGGIDIENNAVRGQINATLSNVTAQPAVTPYIVLHKISKVLAYFHIIMPKRAYLEGDRGVEVIEVKQFGHRMGMTNDGQFVHDVPSKYFLFISYRLASSMGADYSFVGGVASSVGGMFKVTAKLVDEVELQRLLSMAEVELSESCDAEMQQKKAKAYAPKEMMHTALGDCDCGPGNSPSTKAAISDMMRRKDKKLSASDLEEGRMPASVIASKQKYANMSDKDFAEKHGHKSEKELRAMAARHGYGFDKATKTGSDHYVNRVAKSKQMEEAQIDEKLTKRMSAGDVISDFVHSKDPKFKGKSKKERQRMALGAYYGMHPEKSKLEEDAGTTTAQKKLRVQHKTVVRKAIGMERDPETIVVKRRGVPDSKTVRIPKDKFDPSKHVKV